MLRSLGGGQIEKKNVGGQSQRCKNNMPPGVTQTFLGQNNIKNGFSTIKLLRMQFSANSNNF